MGIGLHWFSCVLSSNADLYQPRSMEVAVERSESRQKKTDQTCQIGKNG